MHVPASPLPSSYAPVFCVWNLGILGVKFYMKLKGISPSFNGTITNALFGYSGYCIEIL